jgi:hypothetical protein
MVYHEVNQSEQLTNTQTQLRPRYFTTKMRRQELFTNLARVKLIYRIPIKIFTSINNDSNFRAT